MALLSPMLPQESAHALSPTHEAEFLVVQIPEAVDERDHLPGCRVDRQISGLSIRPMSTVTLPAPEATVGRTDIGIDVSAVFKRAVRHAVHAIATGKLVVTQSDDCSTLGTHRSSIVTTGPLEPSALANDLIGCELLAIPGASNARTASMSSRVWKRFMPMGTVRSRRYFSSSATMC